MRNINNKSSSVYGENIANEFMTFDNTATWNIVSGTGVSNHSSLELFEGIQSLRINNTDVANPITVNYTASNIDTEVNYDGNYFVSFYVLNDTNETLAGNCRVYKNAELEKTISFEVTPDDESTFIEFFDYLSLSKGDDLSYDFTLDANPSSLLASNTIYIDGFGIYHDNRNLVLPPLYNKPKANGNLNESFGIYDYNDLTTQSAPIPLTLANTQYELTNDGAGANTNKTYKLTGIDDIWDTSTNRFDFSSLSLGDRVDIRFDVEVTTSTVNTAVDMQLELAVGGVSYQLPLVPSVNFKSSGTYDLIRWIGIYMGNTDTKDNPARVLMSADNTGVTVKVNGWYISPMKRLV